MSTLVWSGLGVHEGKTIPANWNLSIKTSLPSLTVEYAAIAAFSYQESGEPPPDPPIMHWADELVDGATFGDWGTLKNITEEGESLVEITDPYKKATQSEDEDGNCTYKVRVQYRIVCADPFADFKVRTRILTQSTDYLQQGTLDPGEITTTEVTKDTGEVVVITGEIATPDPEFYSWLAGCVMIQAPQFLLREHKFGSLVKQGFRAFKPPDDATIRVYKEQTATGKGSGSRIFSEYVYGSGLKDPAGTDTDTLDFDTRNSGWIMRPIPAWNDPPAASHTDTLTTRTVPDADPEEPSLVLTLANLYTTSELIAAVAVNADIMGGGNLELPYPQVAAWKYTSPCETWRSTSEGKLKIDGNYAPLVVNNGIHTLTCRWTKAIVNLTTGHTTTEEVSETVAWDLEWQWDHEPGELWEPPITDLGDFTSSEGQMIRLYDARFDYDPIIECGILAEPPDQL